MSGFWVGAAFGVAGIILPSLGAFAALVMRAPLVGDDRTFDRILLPDTMECATAGL